MFICNGSALRNCRKKKGMTQADLAESSGCSIHYISDMENGKRLHPSADILFRCSNALDVPAEALMDFSETPNE